MEFIFSLLVTNVIKTQIILKTSTEFKNIISCKLKIKLTENSVVSAAQNTSDFPSGGDRPHRLLHKNKT
jgi:hypothetical protein